MHVKCTVFLPFLSPAHNKWVVMKIKTFSCILHATRKNIIFLLDLCYINRIKSNKNNIFIINKQIEMSGRNHVKLFLFYTRLHIRCWLTGCYIDQTFTMSCNQKWRKSFFSLFEHFFWRQFNFTSILHQSNALCLFKHWIYALYIHHRHRIDDMCMEIKIRDYILYVMPHKH